MKSEKISTVHVSKDSEEGRAEACPDITRPEEAKGAGRAEARPYIARPEEAKGAGRAEARPYITSGAKERQYGDWRSRASFMEERQCGAKGDSGMTRKRGKEGVVDAKVVDAKQVWTQLEEQVVPRLRLTVIERAVYAHLLRLSRLEGRVRVRFSIASLGRGTCLSGGPVRNAVRRLATQGALRLVQRSKLGHVAEVRLPEEIRGAWREQSEGSGASGRENGRARRGEERAPAASLEETDFMQSKALRQSIHLREGGRCFYCLRRLAPTVRCLDHVVPRAQQGRNGYRNLVSSCLECNAQKGERRAGDYVRWLYRERRLTAGELGGRLRALDALAAGKLRPAMQTLGRSRLAPRTRDSLHLKR